jgi:hypothetical protein
MNNQVANTMDQIVSLFHPTQPITIPRGEASWVVVEAIDLSEAAALCLALSFFLRQTGNRAGRRHQAKKPDLLSVSS